MLAALTLTNLQPLLKKFAVVLGVFLVLAVLLYTILTRPGPQVRKSTIPEEFLHPKILAEDEAEPFGVPFQKSLTDPISGGPYSPGPQFISNIKRAVTVSQNPLRIELYFDPGPPIPILVDSGTKLSQTKTTDLKPGVKAKITYAQPKTEIRAIELFLISE